MANTCDIDSNIDVLLRDLRRAIQSARLNFVIGAGCSMPALAPLGDVETQVQQLYEQNKVEEAESLIFDFLRPFLNVSCKMINREADPAINDTLRNYKAFLNIISHILFRNANNILPKQANVFSTNYDLFVEVSAEEIRSGLRVADGFVRGPLIAGASSFSISEFFTSVYNNGHSYNYRVEVPTVNLIKLHGCEVEAEAVALLCCESLGLEGANFCRGYIQNWLRRGVEGNAEAVPEKSAQKIFRGADQILRAGRTINAQPEEYPN
jgi:hypothetical protein